MPPPVTAAGSGGALIAPPAACLPIDIRVEGLETDSINTASRADSSMLLVLRPLTIFEMKARASGTDDNGA